MPGPPTAPLHAPASLLEGVDAAVCNALGISNLRHRSALHSLSLPEEIDLARLVYEAVAANWSTGRAADNRDRSAQNWRWCVPQPQIGAANKSPEVVLERAIAAACVALGRDDWANQVPVASGLIRGAADGRRAIDLVHMRGARHFQFVELKIASDTPLYAAVELLGYASIWLLTRANPPTRPSALLQADTVDLRVLAPAAYYAPFALARLEAAVDAGVRLLGAGSGVALSFGFDVLPEGLSATIPPGGKALMRLLEARRPLGQPQPSQPL
ncbi:hypothetical protein [Sphingomonas profundi]|uniref:hypothetical protein n=1 Tax=Alterirhizorhabdus profundi TaxID=2681549 RepID=UPI0012E8E535|nr:hypothetical protein [Sphingomonas profundi]